MRAPCKASRPLASGPAPGKIGAMSLLYRLRALLGGAPSARRTLFIDDVVTEGVEILPATVTDWCRREMAAIAGGEAPGHAGWQNARVRRPDAGAESVADLAIPLAEASEALGARLQPFDAVVTGDPNRPRPTAGRGFGPSPLSAVVVYAPAGSAVVTAIEVTLRGSADDNAAVLTALGALPVELIVADWNRGRVANLGDAAEIAGLVA